MVVIKKIFWDVTFFSDAFSHNDILELAKLAGFKIVEVKKEDLATEKGDENLYYALEKA